MHPDRHPKKMNYKIERQPGLEFQELSHQKTICFSFCEIELAMAERNLASVSTCIASFPVSTTQWCVLISCILTAETAEDINLHIAPTA